MDFQPIRARAGSYLYFKYIYIYIYIVYAVESAVYTVICTSCLCQKPERARYSTSEWGFLTQTTSEYNPVQSKFLCCELLITRKTRIFIEIVFLTQIKSENSHTWRRKLVINMSTSFAPIFSVSLSSFLEI